MCHHGLIPAVLSNSSDFEKTEVLSGPENTIRASLEAFSRVKNKHDTCSDGTLPSVILAIEPIRNAYLELKQRGVKTRFITDITGENLSHCKEMMKIVAELRHLEGVKGNFAVSEEDYMASASQPESAPIPKIIHSNVKAVIDQQDYIFETLWKISISAEKRIREIEEGKKPEVIETMENPRGIEERMFEMLESAREEVLIIFATTNAFHRQRERGLAYLFSKLMERQPLHVRLMIPADNDARQAAATLKQQWQDRVHIRFIEQSMQTKISVLLVDRSLSLAVELRDDSKNSSLEAIGLATYSNSKPTVTSYVSMFETMWTQADLYQKLAEVNDQLLRANEILQDNDMMQKEFINIAAHELRTPIQPILGLSQTLRETSDIPGQQEFLDAIIRNAKRLNLLAEDILEVSRIESNLLNLNYSHFSLDELIRDVESDVGSGRTGNLHPDGVKFSTRVEGIMVNGDRDKLAQVIRNLVSNAVKFTSHGTITITAGKEQETDEVVVSVRDSGTGVDPAILPRLFTKFASKSDGGTGLGLYICKKIVEAHHGEIGAENNTRGKGATFWFKIPVDVKK